MGIFVEFYMIFFGFVNYRLYFLIGFKYLFKFDQIKDDKGVEFVVFMLEGVNFVINEEIIKVIINGEGYGFDFKVQVEVDKLVKKLRIEFVVDKVDEEMVDGEEEEEEKVIDVIDKFEFVVFGGDVLLQLIYSGNNFFKFFVNCIFFFLCEIFCQFFEFIFCVFGCKRIGWDLIFGEGFFIIDEFDFFIIYQIVDRLIVQVVIIEQGDGEDNQIVQKFGFN